MPPFAIAMPQRILFGRGEAQKAPALIAPFGPRGLIVHGANATPPPPHPPRLAHPWLRVLLRSGRTCP